MVTYHQEMGKIHAHTFRKRLHKMGLKDAWFGILNGIIIASGISKENLEQNLDGIIPSYKKDYVYLFRLKPETKLSSCVRRGLRAGSIEIVSTPVSKE